MTSGKCPFNHGAMAASAAETPTIAKPDGCPAFKDNKCPFKDKAAELTGLMSKCPFYDSGECPFKNQASFEQAMKKHATAKGGEWPSTLDGEVDLSKLAAACPAFASGGCPFSNGHAELTSAMKNCPAFEGGCPYKNKGKMDAAILSHLTKETETGLLHLAKKCPTMKGVDSMQSLMHRVHQSVTPSQEATTALQAAVESARNLKIGGLAVKITSTARIGNTTVNFEVEVPTEQ